MSEELHVEASEEPEGVEPETETEAETESEPERGGDPAKALRAERGKRKELSRKLADLEKSNQQLQAMANEYQQLLPVLPQLIEKAKRADAQQQQQAKPDPQLVAIANDLGFLDENGEPDVVRAQRVMGYLDRRAGAIAGQQLEPVRKQTLAQQVEATRQKAYTAVDAEGRPFAKKEAIDQVFSQMPPEALADPNSTSMALLIARGLMGPGDLPDEPTFISGGGTTPNQPPRLSEMEKAIAKMRGKTDKDFAQSIAKMAPPSAAGWAVE